MHLLKNIIAIPLLSIIITSFSPAWNFHYKVYDQRSGLPSLLVESATQTKDGTMWFATLRGIMTFDGTNWREEKIIIDGVDYTNSTFKQIKYSDGNIVAIGYISGPTGIYLFKYDMKKWTIHKIPIDTFGPIKHFEVYSKGNVEYYFVNIAPMGVIFYDGVSGSVLFDTHKVIHTTIINDILYVSTTSGLFTYSIKDRIINLIEATRDISILGVYEDKNGFLNVVSNNWIGILTKDKIIKTKLNIFDKITAFKFYKHEEVSLVNDRYNGTYYGTKSSLYYLSNTSDRFISINSLVELPAEGINYIYIDLEENIWVCTPRGIFKIQKSTFRNYSKQNGLLDNEVSSIFIDDRIILGHNTGFTIFNEEYPNKITIMDSISPLQSNSRVMDIIADDNGNLYAAISQLGVIKFNGNESMIFHPKGGEVTYGLEFFNNKLIISTHKGLCTIDKNEMVPWNLFTLDRDGIRDIIKTNNNLLIITRLSIGLSIYNNKEWTTYTAKDIYLNNIYKLFDNDQIIYAGAMGGLLTFDMEKRILAKQTYPFSIDRPVYMIEKDPKGRMWFGTDDGVYRWDGDYLRYYTTAHGLIGPETNRNASAIDSLGRIWIGTNKGVSVYMEEWDWEPSPPPFVYMTAIETISDSLNPNDPVRLDYDNNDLTFHYVANSFIDEDKVFVSTMLEGFEDEWQPKISSHIQTVRYTNLAPGTYTFRLKAIGIDNIYSAVISTGIITISLPYWERWWFISFVVIGLIGVGYTVRSYIQKRRYTELLEDEVDIRTRHLQQSRENYKMLIETAIDPIIEFDENGKLISWNNSTCFTFKYSHEQLRNSTIEIIFKSHIAFQAYWHGISSYIINETSNIVGHSINQTGITKENQVLDLLISTSVRFRNDKIIFTAFIKDISEQKKLEKELLENLNILANHREDLKRLSLDAIRVQEVERKRISQDLHDQIGQSLSALNISLELIKDQKASGADIEKMVHNCQALVSSTSEEIHRFTFELRPTIIDDLGLANAIREHLEQMAQTTRIEYTIDGNPDESRIPEDFTIIIYRIYQESLTNILKHARATKVSLTFSQSKTHFRMTIKDNGKGFAKHSHRKSGQTGGFGILGMEERARYVGGSLFIDSTPFKGTTVILELPLLPLDD